MIIGFDIGGTNIRVASVSESGIGKVFKEATPQNPSEALEHLAASVAEAASDVPIDAVIGAIPGIPGKRGEVLTAPNLPEWRGFPLCEKLGKLLGARVAVYHDADLGALGEAVYGAGKGFAILAYVTVGTGVGASRLVSGAFDAAAFGFEAGHQILDVQKWKALDDFVSGLAISKRFGRHPKDVPRSAYDELTSVLAAGLYNIILHWSPHVIILGGSMINEENGFRVRDVVRELNRLPKFFPAFPEVRKSALGDEAVLHGARALSVIPKQTGGG